MTDPRPCPLDGHDLPADRYVCHTCTSRLRGLLTDLAGLMDDLDAALARQLHFGSRVGSRSTSIPLPINLTASEAAWVARQTILVWTDWIANVRGHHVPQTWATIGTYLQTALDWAAHHPDGPDCIDELTGAVRQARRATDRPADRRYAGICGGTCGGTEHPCTEQLYAITGRDTITCPKCGTRHDVHARRTDMLDRMRDIELNATDLARAVDGLGLPLTANRIWQWKKRGTLTPALNPAGNPKADRDGRPLYRVGDVLDVVAAHATCAMT